VKNITGCVLKGFVLIAGLASLVLGIQYLSVDSSSLLEAQAKVISTSQGTTDDNGVENFSVTYQYEVDGVPYESSYTSSREYAPGEMITVYYDPEAPDSSFNSQGEANFLGLVGVLFGLFCIGSLGWGVVRSMFSKLKK
jgi:hypothetical protein